jgi:uncharacterized membrane protein/predicted DsbA family dithiol-disulfide isomerase
MRKRSKPLRQSGPPPISTRLFGTLVGLAAAGFGASVYLTYVSDRLRGDANFHSLCAINDLVDCDRVISSAYGSLGGIPLAWFAAWFYAFFALMALGARRPTGSLRMRSPALLLLLASAFAVGVSLMLAAVSLFILRGVCLFCVTLYGVNLALLLTSWIALRSSGETFTNAFSAERRHRRPRQLIMSASVIPLVLVLGPVMTHHAVWGRSRFCELVAEAHPARDEPLRLTIYSDVQCPHCRALNQLLRPLRSAPSLRILPRQYPLDPVCNPSVKGAGHAGACLQAQALLCANAQGQYDALSERLYAGGPADRKGLIDLAASVGLNDRQFADCLSSPQTVRQLAADIASGKAAGVRGTPTIIFEKGQRYFGNLTAEDLTCLSSGATPSFSVGAKGSAP